MTKMYIEKYTVMGAGWYIYRESTAAAINQSDKRRRSISDKVPDGEVRIRAIRISEIIVTST
jgi:hypothetical protein